MSKFSLDEGIIEANQINYFYFATYILFFTFIVFGNFPAFSHPRWNAGLDINGDGIFSITDLVKWAVWIFYMPGDVLLQSFMVFQATTNFFEIGKDSYGNIESLLFSFFYWHLIGGKKLVIYWAVILLLIVLKNIPNTSLLS